MASLEQQVLNKAAPIVKFLSDHGVVINENHPNWGWANAIAAPFLDIGYTVDQFIKYWVFRVHGLTLPDGFDNSELVNDQKIRELFEEVKAK